MKKLLFLIPVLAFFSSCKKDSSEIDQAKIFQSYSISYDEDTDKTTVSASFFEEKLNGKNLELTGSSTITINGTALAKSGTIYSASISGNLPTATFIFTDNDGKKYTNTLTKANSIANDGTSYLDNSTSTYWYWSGAALAAGETVKLKFANVADDTKTANFSETTVGKTYVSLSASGLSVLPDGNTKVFISRSTASSAGDFSGVGGKITTSYNALYNYVEVY